MLSNNTSWTFANVTANINGTSQEPDASWPKYDAKILTILTPMYWVLSGIIVASNGALLLLYIGNKAVRQSLNYFVMSQLVIDMLVGMVGIPLVLIYPRQRLTMNTDVSDGVCIVTLVVQLGVTTIVPWALSYIAMDRLVAVALPSSYKTVITKSRSAVAIALLWWFVLFINMLPLMNLDSIGGEKWRSYCSGHYRYPIAYLHAVVYLLFAIPILLTAVCYVAMYVVIKRKGSQSALSVGAESHRSFQKAVRAAKTCLLTTLLVCFGWVPYLGFMIVLPLVPNVSFATRIYSFSITFLFAAAVSAANPLVYFARSSTIKTALKRTFNNRVVPVNGSINDTTNGPSNASLILSHVDTTVVTQMTVNTGMGTTSNTNKISVRLKPRSSRMES